MVAISLPTSQALIQWVLEPDWSILNGLALILTILFPLALISLYSEQVVQRGLLGLIGFLMVFIGLMLFTEEEYFRGLSQ